MPLREACKHGRWEWHLVNPSGVKPHLPCDGGRVLSDAEALRTLLFDGDEPKDGVKGGWVQNGLSPCVYPTDDPDEIDVYVIPKSLLEGDS
jgi:hypothetical protein